MNFAFAPPLPPQDENIINRNIQMNKSSSVSLKKNNYTATFAGSVLSPPPAPRTNGVFSPTRSAFGSTVNSMYQIDSREAGIQAKFMCTQQKIDQVALEKRKWAEEKEQQLTMNIQRRNQQLSLYVRESNRINSMYKINKEKKEIFEKTKKIEEIKSLQESLDAHSQLQRDLMMEKKRKRRESVLKNTKIRTLCKNNTQKILSNEKKRRESLYKAKYNDFLDVNKYNNDLRKKKRESLMMRNRHAREEKMILSDIKEKNREFESSLYQSKYENWKNLREYTSQCNQKRRLSLSKSLYNYYHQEKVILDELKKKEAEIEHDFLNSKYEGWKDINEYQEVEQQKRRDSLCFRLNQWRKEKKENEIREKEAAFEREQEARLQEACREDVRKYHELEKQKRRESLQYRLNKARSDRIFDEGQKAFDLEIKQIEEDYKMKDRQALKDYYSYEQEKRRQSLQFRNQLGFEHARMDEANRQMELEEDRKNFEDAYQNWKNLNEYYQTEKKKRRESLVFRLKEAHRHRLYYLQLHQEKLKQIHYDLNCRREDWIALQEYKEQEKEKERFSLQLQLQSWREYKIRLMKEKEEKHLKEEKDRILKQIDRDALLEHEFLTKLNKIKDINSSLTF